VLLNFDYDGVIVDSFDRLLNQCRQAQQQLQDGRRVVSEDLRTLEQLTFEALARKIGLSGDNVQRFEALVHDIQKADETKCPLFPEIKQVLQQLAKEHKITVITSSDSSAVETEIKRMGIGPPIIDIVLGPDSANEKHERISQCCTEYSYAPEDTYMIGDAVSDIRQGKVAGVNTIAVLWGYQDRDLLKLENPTYIVDAPKALLTLLQY
jgi:phosphoglycolate phosphatase